MLFPWLDCIIEGINEAELYNLMEENLVDCRNEGKTKSTLV
jgi:hypothetical protein